MNASLAIFVGITCIILGGLGYFFRNTFSNIETIASEHAKIYAVAYVKGGALILIAAGAAFDTGFQALSPAFQATMTWAPYAIFFWKPIAGGLAVLVAFLDRSTQRASEEAANAKAKRDGTTAPFPDADPTTKTAVHT